MEMNEDQKQQKIKRPTINKNNQQRRRFYTRRRGRGQQPLTFFVLLFSLISYCSLTTTECATFFYGGTMFKNFNFQILSLQYSKKASYKISQYITSSITSLAFIFF